MANSVTGPTLSEAISALPPAQRRAVEKRAAELIAEEMSIRELRKSLALTQTQVAKSLGKGQHEISRIEQRGDLLLSTLSGLIQAMGGELELVCRFSKRPPVRIVPPTLARSTRQRAKSVARPRGRRLA